LSTPDRHELWASLALRATRGIGPRTWKRLLEAYGSAYAASQDAKAWVERGLTSEAQAKAFRSEAWRESARPEWEAIHRHRPGVLLWNDPAYPACLREISDPPLYLYYHGDISLLANPAVAIVGTRQSTAYGREATKEIGEGLSRAGITIVSGLAYGIDRQAHLAGLSSHGSSIAVLGASLDVDYPSGNRDVRQRLEQQGLVLSELPPSTPPEPRHFPVRNRIISGLSLAVVVIEAARPSGSIITAKLGLEQGREVYAVPGPRTAPQYSGCFDLINQGAKVICCADDILRELAPVLATTLPRAGSASCRETATADQADTPASDAETATAVATRRPGKRPHDRPARQNASDRPAAIDVVLNLAPDERAVVDLFSSGQRLHIDTIGANLGWEASRASQVLLMLELRGVVQKWPGMLYSIAGKGGVC